MKSVMRTVLSLACLLWFGSTALAAEPRTLRLGHMELVYDAERWIAERSNDDFVTMRPIGAIWHRQLRRIGAYWTAGVALPGADQPAGRSCRARRLMVRRAHPLPQPHASGVVICIHNRGSAFLLTMNMVNCGGRGSPFLRTDLLQELIGGIRFP